MLKESGQAAMKTISNRIRKLEIRLFPDSGQPQRLWVSIESGCELALDPDRCTQILDECGFLPTGRFGVVNLCGISDGLNARELEQFLRRNGAETRNLGGRQHSRQVSQAQIASDWVRC
jgi:hypothetical protein